MKKKQFEERSKVTEKVRNCVISIYTLLRNFKNHLRSVAACFDKVLFYFFSKSNIYYKNMV